MLWTQFSPIETKNTKKLKTLLNVGQRSNVTMLTWWALAWWLAWGNPKLLNKVFPGILSPCFPLQYGDTTSWTGDQMKRAITLNKTKDLKIVGYLWLWKCLSLFMYFSVFRYLNTETLHTVYVPCIPFIECAPTEGRWLSKRWYPQSFQTKWTFFSPLNVCWSVLVLRALILNMLQEPYCHSVGLRGLCTWESGVALDNCQEKYWHWIPHRTLEKQYCDLPGSAFSGLSTQQVPTPCWLTRVSLSEISLYSLALVVYPSAVWACGREAVRLSIPDSSGVFQRPHWPCLSKRAGPLSRLRGRKSIGLGSFGDERGLRCHCGHLLSLSVWFGILPPAHTRWTPRWRFSVQAWRGGAHGARKPVSSALVWSFHCVTDLGKGESGNWKKSLNVLSPA